MKGLIINDIFSMKKLMKTMLVVFVAFGIAWAVMGQAETGAAIIGVLGVTYLLNLFSYDEFYHWENYVAVLPLSRKQVVLARYLSFGLTVVVFQLVSAVYLLITGSLDANGISTMFGVLLMQIYVGIVLIPVWVLSLTILFFVAIPGIGRFIYILLLGLPFLLVIAASGWISSLEQSSAFDLMGLLGIVVLGMLLLLFVSFRWSVAILSKKEY